MTSPTIPAREAMKMAIEALEAVVAATHSHVDGRDLLAELHPRNMLDIKRRIDARETWFEGDWLSDVWAAVKNARAALTALRQAAEHTQQGGANGVRGSDGGQHG